MRDNREQSYGAVQNRTQVYTVECHSQPSGVFAHKSLSRLKIKFQIKNKDPSLRQTDSGTWY